MSPKTISSASKTLDDVIACALDSFRAVGYRKTTVGDVASRLHISKKTLYSLIASKEELLKEVAWRDTLNAVQIFGDTISRDTRPESQLMAFCRFAFTDRIKRGTSGYFWGVQSGEEILARAYRSSLKRVLGRIYDAGRKTGIFKPLDISFAAETITAMIVTALGYFPSASNPAAMFNDALAMIADSMANKQRIPFDSMG